MGVIRKTASVGTLGLVNFRSKKEKLRRAESSRDAEHLAREAAETGFARVEGELKKLSAAEAKAVKQLARLRRRSRKVRKADRLTAVLNTAQPVMHDTMTAARKQGRRARRAAGRASHEVKRGAERTVTEARQVISSS